jgi:uncharacterized membrane protein
MAVLAAAATIVAVYLTWTKLSGTAPVCAIGGGCETVASSVYSSVLGIPVAAFGAIGSALTLAGSLVWWRRVERRGLLLAYLVGLVSLPILGYLFYLEIAVIHAICTWCVTYAILTIATWVVASVALVRSSRASPSEPSRATGRRPRGVAPGGD